MGDFAYSIKTILFINCYGKILKTNTHNKLWTILKNPHFDGGKVTPSHLNIVTWGDIAFVKIEGVNIEISKSHFHKSCYNPFYMYNY